MKLVIVLLTMMSQFAWAKLTIGTYNIRNFDYDERAQIHTNKPELKTLLGSLNFDLLGVNEINNVAEFEKFISANFSKYDTQISNCGGAHGQRLGFVFNKAKLKLLAFNEDLSVSQPGGAGACNSGTRPLAIATFETLENGMKFYAIQVHLKAGGTPTDTETRLKQYAIVKTSVNKLTQGAIKEFVIMGDFNTTGYSARDNDYTSFVSMVSGIQGNDLSSSVACSAYWWGGSDDGMETPSLLDHIIISQGIKAKSASAKAQVHAHCKKVSCRFASPTELGVTYESVSDHCPQTANLL